MVINSVIILSFTPFSEIEWFDNPQDCAQSAYAFPVSIGSGHCRRIVRSGPTDGQPWEVTTMTAHLAKTTSAKRQGRLLAFGVTGAMALAVTACDRRDTTMIVPPGGFSPTNAVYYNNTNQPPTNTTILASPGCAGYVAGHGYYPVYGYPNYYYRPTPGSTIEVVSGETGGYVASSPDEARSVAHGGFGSSGEGEGGHGGGEGGHGFGGGE
jgi:hypothetical protein